MDITKVFEIFFQYVIPLSGLAAGGSYGAKKAKKKLDDILIQKSGLLELSNMDLDMVDRKRAMNVVELSKAYLLFDIDEFPDAYLRRAARSLNQLCGVYSRFRKQVEHYPEPARNEFFRSWGVRIYIDKRYIEDPRVHDDLMPLIDDFS
jgi:hypothetical protein